MKRSSREITERAMRGTQRHARRHPPTPPRWRTMTRLERAEVVGVGLLVLGVFIVLPFCDRAT